MTKKNIFIFIILVIALFSIYIKYTNNSPQRMEVVQNTDNVIKQDEIQNPNIQETNSLPKQNTEELAIKDKAWIVLEKYLDFAKNHDIKNLSKISYQVSEICKDKSKEKECFERMDAVYFIGKELKKSDFKYVWQDDKQIILTTDFKFEENESMISKSRGMIYFVIDKEIKVLSFNHAKGSVVTKSTASIEELKDRLNTYTKDIDEDGKEDYLEECLSSSQGSECIKTDTKIKDSDKDGFWDGIEALFYK